MVRGLLEGSEEGRRAVRGDGRYGDADAGLGLRLMKLKIQGRRFNLTWQEWRHYQGMLEAQRPQLPR